ncbi:MAG: LysR family transcriptional regulator [Anaerolineaceae bacterium]|nr:LysR family transcriptional regulator [Anaerolineaceae bacterium]
MLDLYKLQIFSAVVQAGSFSAAAERLYITQSAVSQHIKELELGLGRPLFQRGWRGVKLTPHGEILNRYTIEIFELVAKAENALVDVNQLTSGRISIGATPGIAIYLAPDWVQHFRSHYSQLTVVLQTGVTPQIVSDVLSQRLDIGFIEGELDDHISPHLSSLVLEEIEQQVVVGFKHPFWEHATVDIEDLRDQSLIVREANSQSRVWLEQNLHRHDIEPVIGAEFDNLESMKRAVSLGRCLAVLPPYVVQTEVEQHLLHMIPITGKPLTRSLKLIWDSNVPFTPITHAFLTELGHSFPVLNGLLERISD